MLYDPAIDVSIVLFSSLIDFDDIGTEAKVLFDIVTRCEGDPGVLRGPWRFCARGPIMAR